MNTFLAIMNTSPKGWIRIPDCDEPNEEFCWFWAAKTAELGYYQGYQHGYALGYEHAKQNERDFLASLFV